jgi:hypothetical protein
MTKKGAKPSTGECAELKAAKLKAGSDISSLAAESASIRAHYKALAKSYRPPADVYKPAMMRIKAGSSSVESSTAFSETVEKLLEEAMPGLLQGVNAFATGFLEQLYAEWPKPNDGESSCKATGRSAAGLRYALVISKSQIKILISNVAKDYKASYGYMIKGRKQGGANTWRVLAEIPVKTGDVTPKLQKALDGFMKKGG